ncbi:hypothetical protein Fmac_029098 [Flemingia macrophylla]|uniref:Uncharacterized protein n=1 Tax=Flemingia macrophylla TaxID=520843 RepID=A0ABD1L9E3_9FABA
MGNTSTKHREEIESLFSVFPILSHLHFQLSTHTGTNTEVARNNTWQREY